MNSERMEGILSLIPKSEIIIDVGTDHAYIPEAIIKRNISKKVIGTEINQKPYLKAKEYVNMINLDDSIEIRKGDGLHVIDEDELKVVIVAGMGGLLINKIIKENLSKFQDNDIIITQPMNAVDKNRKFLDENDFEIIDEILCKEDHHYYSIIKAKYRRGYKSSQKNIQYITNEILFKKRDKYIEEFINKKIKKNNIIIENIKKNSSNIIKVKELEKINKMLKELLKKYEFKVYS
jgi:tRNA (adenine22-N1)-methyltransferase